MMAEVKHTELVGLIKISANGECRIEILPLQGAELPLLDGEEVVICAK